MGWQQAARVLLASEWVTADEAVASGLALRTCPDGTVLGRDAGAGPDDRLVPAARHPADQAADAGRPGLRPSADARRREEAAFAALFADPDVNPGANLAAGLGD